MRKALVYILSVASLVFLIFPVSCVQQRKVSYLSRTKLGANIQLPSESGYVSGSTMTTQWDGKIEAERDTLVVTDDEGRQMLIMKAERSADGEMVATDVLDAAVVTARFRNVAERDGKIDIEFQVVVPKNMKDSKWQLRLTPDMFILEDSIRLDAVNITGENYRKAQLRGYQQYERWLKRIIAQNGEFIRRRDLETFLERNIPEVWAMRHDTTFVSDEQFLSLFGVSEQEAVEHYTRKWALARNERRKLLKGAMFNKYVKVPLVTEGLRLDTVLVSDNGDFVYNYVQRVYTRPRLRKIDVVLGGAIYEQDRQIYDVPRSAPLTFYISSLSSFVDSREKYLTKVVERRVDSSTECYIEFDLARSEVDLGRGSNYDEVRRIKDYLGVLIEDSIFDVDSVVVSAGASPEGEYRYNQRLSERRAESVSRYFERFIRNYSDSIGKERGFSVDEKGRVHKEKARKIDFISHTGGEDWSVLARLVGRDTLLTDAQKEAFFATEEILDYDMRELALKQQDSYQYLRERLYPRLRSVKFDFHLHRKGMQKDTIHTTVLDTAYMRGVQAIKDHDYKLAASILRPYHDYNAAVAFTALGYNQSALEILLECGNEARIHYMLALIYSRLDDKQEAVQYYLRSCREERAYIHRGNLDPEIASLIRDYSLRPILQKIAN